MFMEFSPLHKCTVLEIIVFNYLFVDKLPKCRIKPFLWLNAVFPVIKYFTLLKSSPDPLQPSCPFIITKHIALAHMECMGAHIQDIVRKYEFW